MGYRSFRFVSFRLPIVLSFRFVWFPCLVMRHAASQRRTRPPLQWTQQLATCARQHLCFHFLFHHRVNLRFRFLIRNNQIRSLLNICCQRIRFQMRHRRCGTKFSNVNKQNGLLRVIYLVCASRCWAHFEVVLN